MCNFLQKTKHLRVSPQGLNKVKMNTAYCIFKNKDKIPASVFNELKQALALDYDKPKKGQVAEFIPMNKVEIILAIKVFDKSIQIAKMERTSLNHLKLFCLNNGISIVKPNPFFN